MILLVTVAFAFAIVLLAVAMMAIGVINGRKPISGSCGGLGTANGSCELCGGSSSCEDRK